ncbi:MAG: MFS transporter [Chloroflexi bacterium]|nr:MFS transporter [Chloroflexota bacterium]
MGNQNRSPELSRLDRLRSIYREYPAQFWVVVFGTFIDRLGGAMMFPFFTLYITQKFNIGMTQVGGLFFLFSISAVVGSIAGGALTDRLGRKIMMIFGLVMSATSALLIGTIDQLALFMLVVPVVGLLAESGGPASQALVADILPEEKQAEGYGIIRVAFNLSVAIGPVLGGFLASRSFILLFIADAVASLITAGIVFFVIQESRKPAAQDQPPESVVDTFKGYGRVLQDRAFLWFMVASMLSALVYLNMNTTLPVYLRDNHSVTTQGFGYILSLNAIMVVLLQFPTTRWVNRYRPLIVMTVGTLLYALGFAMYGFVNLYALFLVAMVIITIGEMMVSPVGQAIIARMAPADMRGRYMAAFGFSWVIPSAVGPVLAGLVLDNLNPDLLWYFAGIIGVLSALTYFALEQRAGQTKYAAVNQRLEIMERLENGDLSVEEAARLLEGIGEGTWAKLAGQHVEAPRSRRSVRIRVSDLRSGAVKSELSLPVGLVSMALHANGKLSPALERYSLADLGELISRSLTKDSPQQLETDDERVDISLE